MIPYEFLAGRRESVDCVHCGYFCLPSGVGGCPPLPSPSGICKTHVALSGRAEQLSFSRMSMHGLERINARPVPGNHPEIPNK
jgi:hypothetical protein